jgi:hypothetical protein
MAACINVSGKLVGMGLPLTLRPPACESPAPSPILYEDGQEIGRLREEQTPAKPDLAWLVDHGARCPSRVRTEGHAPTLERGRQLRRTRKKPRRAWGLRRARFPPPFLG